MVWQITMATARTTTQMNNKYRVRWKQIINLPMRRGLQNNHDGEITQFKLLTETLGNNGYCIFKNLSFLQIESMKTQNIILLYFFILYFRTERKWDHCKTLSIENVFSSFKWCLPTMRLSSSFYKLPIVALFWFFTWLLLWFFFFLPRWNWSNDRSSLWRERKRYF